MFHVSFAVRLPVPVLNRKLKTKRKCFPILEDCSSAHVEPPRIDACPFVSAVDPCYSRSTVSYMFLWFTFKQCVGEQSASFVAVCSKPICHLELSCSHLANRERSQRSWLQAALFSQLCYNFSEWVLTLMKLMTVPCFQLCLCKVCSAVPEAGKGSVVFWRSLQCLLSSKLELWRRRSQTKPTSS